jgi:Tfp pilus assembly pilus retraction ATPase PilT
MPIELDRILETAVNQNAAEAWLLPGKPLLFRIDDCLRGALINPVSAEDVEQIFVKESRAKYDAKGFVDFALTYGTSYENYAVFAVSVFKTSDGPIAILRLRRPRFIKIKTS